MNKKIQPILSLFRLALFGLKMNRFRSFLTVLGIVIGIAAVIIVLSAGNSVQEYILSQLESFGSDFVVVEVKVPNISRNSAENALAQAQGVTITTLKISDMRDIIALPGVATAYAGIMGQEVVSYLDENKKINLFGVSSTYVEVDASAKIAEGRFFSDVEEAAAENVAVLGSGVKEKLFGLEDAVGKRVKIGKQKYTVVGVFQERGNNLFMNMDDTIVLPVKTLQKKILGIDYVSFIFAKGVTEESANDAVPDIQHLLRQNHRIVSDDPDKDDFAVTTMAESQELISTIIGGMTILLIAIAGISLAVGGVGIMNIMYVSVTERTYEIGLRKSVGATRKSILWQFLLESVFLTLSGAVIGIIVGVAISFLISLIAGSLGFAWVFQISFLAIFMAVGFSTMIGIIFGIAPARRAAFLEPVTAMRQDEG